MDKEEELAWQCDSSTVLLPYDVLGVSSGDSLKFHHYRGLFRYPSVGTMSSPLNSRCMVLLFIVLRFIWKLFFPSQIISNISSRDSDVVTLGWGLGINIFNKSVSGSSIGGIMGHPQKNTVNVLLFLQLTWHTPLQSVGFLCFSK